MNKRTSTSSANSSKSNSNSYIDQPQRSKDSSSEGEEIVILIRSKRSRVDIINEEVKGWKYSSKQPESLPEPTKTKEEFCLEEMKQKAEKSALEWDGVVLQEELKILMCIDRSLLGDPRM